jgi:NADPH:quinone reductase-like Zn-dependent oxidoreductase
MKAITFHTYGTPEVLQIEEISKPVSGNHDILIRVHATTVNYGDLVARNIKNVKPGNFNMPLIFLLMAKLYFGVKKPKVKVLGSEFSGVVESTGKDVTGFKTGDQVFGYSGQSMGAYAEHICMPENGCVALKPENINHEEAAGIPYGSIMAFNLLSKMNIKPGQKILVNGAGGGIGSAAVQIANHHFKAEVTGVCRYPQFDHVKSMGADKVIDYKNEDFTERDEAYDIIFDVPGRSSYSKCKQSLKPTGRYFLASFKLKQLLQMLFTTTIHLINNKSKRVICSMAPGNKEDLYEVLNLIRQGKIKPGIDKVFDMNEASAAHRYVEEGKAAGKVVIRIA